MKKILGIILALSLSTWAIDAFYRHHQKTTTAGLEASLVNREIGIDASSRNSVIAKKADGSLIHLISKEMDSITLTGVVNITGPIIYSSAVTFSSYPSGRVPYFTTGGLMTSAATMTYNGTTLAVNNGTYSGTLGVNGPLTATTVVASGSVTADTVISSKFYAEGSFTATLKGCASDPTGTAYYTRLGKHVTLALPFMTCTADSAGAAITGLPASIASARPQGFPVNLVEASTNTNNTSSGLVVDGAAVRFYIGTSPSALFSASGTRQLAGNHVSGGFTTITYTLQ